MAGRLHGSEGHGSLRSPTSLVATVVVAVLCLGRRATPFVVALRAVFSAALGHTGMVPLHTKIRRYFFQYMCFSLTRIFYYTNQFKRMVPGCKSETEDRQNSKMGCGGTTGLCSSAAPNKHRRLALNSVLSSESHSPLYNFG